MSTATPLTILQGVRILIYQTKDGYLALSMSPLPVLQDALQVPELAPLATERFNHPAREQVARILEPVMRTRTTAEWVEYLVPRGVWAVAARGKVR